MHPLQLTGRAWGHQFVNWNSAQAHGAIGTADRGGVSPNVCGGCHCENSRNNAKFKTQVACVKAPLRFLAEHGAVLNVKTAPTAMAHGWPLRTRRSRARASICTRARARACPRARSARGAAEKGNTLGWGPRLPFANCRRKPSPVCWGPPLDSSQGFRRGPRGPQKGHKARCGRISLCGPLVTLLGPS